MRCTMTGLREMSDACHPVIIGEIADLHIGQGDSVDSQSPQLHHGDGAAHCQMKASVTLLLSLRTDASHYRNRESSVRRQAAERHLENGGIYRKPVVGQGVPNCELFGGRSFSKRGELSYQASPKLLKCAYDIRKPALETPSPSSTAVSARSTSMTSPEDRPPDKV